MRSMAGKITRDSGADTVVCSSDQRDPSAEPWVLHAQMLKGIWVVKR